MWRTARVLLAFVVLSTALPAIGGAGPEDDSLRPGTIVDARTGAPLTLESLLPLLAQQDILYIGEEHHNRWHVEAAVAVIDGLVARGRRPVLALEMFGWDGQDALDRYVGGEEDRTAFLRDAQWERNWGGAFEDYEPLIATASRHALPVAALNPPLPLVRRVAKQGLAEALFDPDMARWRMRNEPFVDDPPYRDAIVRQIRRCHGGMREDGYERMYQASLFRDEAMARTLAARLAGLQRPGDGPVVSYTGGGHIQHRLPVPQRVDRRRPQTRSVTIYLSAVEAASAVEIQELVRGHIADYVWLTRIGDHGPPGRCG